MPLRETYRVMTRLSFRPLGHAAILVGLPRSDADLVETAQELADSMRAALGSAALDVVPAYDSVLVRFDPFVTPAAKQLTLVSEAVEQVAIDFGADSGSWRRSPRHVTLGVCFGGQFGLDFEQTAHDLGMRERRMRDLFCQGEYRVGFLGFLAGFPYLLGLPAAFGAVNRRTSPRPRVVGGSVAIAAGQCGVYPRTASGGWHLLGQTAAILFDPDRNPAALLRPGDRITFEPRDVLADATAEFS